MVWHPGSILFVSQHDRQIYDVNHPRAVHQRRRT
jgi:hypothetical protein